MSSVRSSHHSCNSGMDNASVESAPANIALKRCHELWFDDGNVVLEAEGVGFKVYKGYLAKQSPVFAAMFTIPASQSLGEMYEDCPLVHMPDPYGCLRYLLVAMHDPRYAIYESSLPVYLT
jgi:hypothetical protein